MGQLSSAILEYETILQRYPNDPDVQAALNEIESKANNFPLEAMPAETNAPSKAPGSSGKGAKTGGKAALEIEDGQRTMYKIFVESKLITAGDFELCWSTPDPLLPPSGVIEPFIQILADKGILVIEKSLRVLCDKSRAAYLPLKNYEIDTELARTFPAATCRRWCVLPFDRMSKSVFVATANPFNQQAAKELARATANRLLWYIVPPMDLVANVRKAFR
jgi:hypothetical protein